MKRLFFILGVVLLFVGTITFAKSSNNEGLSENNSSIIVEQAGFLSPLDFGLDKTDGIGCKKEITNPDGTKEVKSCWVCDCEKL